MKITKQFQSITNIILLLGLPASFRVASSLLFPAIYKHLHKQHNNKVQAPASLLATSSLLLLTTLKQGRLE